MNLTRWTDNVTTVPRHSILFIMPEQTGNTRITYGILTVLALTLSMVCLQLNPSNACVLVQIPHTTVFFTFLLMLALHSRLAAYILLPLVLAGAATYDVLYDLAGSFLHITTVNQFVELLRVQQHLLRHIYQLSIWTLLSIAALISIVYLNIFILRRFLSPVISGDCIHLQALACCYICFSMILFPFRIIIQ